MRKALRVCGRSVLLSMLCLMGLSVCSYGQTAALFCDDFEDGNGWESRWTVGLHTATVVASPVHSGTQALKLRGVNGDCHAYVYRTDFEACTGEYSAWVNQQHFEAGFSILVQVQPGASSYPSEREGYELLLSAHNSQAPTFLLVRRHEVGPGDVLGSKPSVLFNLSEWVRIFIRRLPGGGLVAGYEMTNGTVDSLVAFDPNSITDPGAFYLWSCSDGPPTDNFFDDACYEPIPCSYVPPPCPFSAGDVNCDGWTTIQDVVEAVNEAFRGHEPYPPCCKSLY